ncbi:hypothetical protein K505DRAFT_343795 [Melanomma pulvis-pyrius CBS 109.77]|uniref:Uncharacterized protein n=1 Tax=Melanomma pulvis-pyrius CBS 109.77 TaxID=1314802 RepID=A0A6A6WRD5_9PLEO|nr:hypothetical protein K505DRAFT_343795 [Melanomma pulvis-pyrius CBS 109.77]
MVHFPTRRATQSINPHNTTASYSKLQQHSQPFPRSYHPTTPKRSTHYIHRAPQAPIPTPHPPTPQHPNKPSSIHPTTRLSVRNTAPIHPSIHPSIHRTFPLHPPTQAQPTRQDPKIRAVHARRSLTRKREEARRRAASAANVLFSTKSDARQHSYMLPAGAPRASERHDAETTVGILRSPAALVQGVLPACACVQERACGMALGTACVRV